MQALWFVFWDGAMILNIHFIFFLAMAPLRGLIR